MNGKCAKRIRLAAVKQIDARRAVSGEKPMQTYKRLKREYKALPYHRRALAQFGGARSHSSHLKQHHEVRA